jgi:hypothetical protein
MKSAWLQKLMILSLLTLFAKFAMAQSPQTVFQFVSAPGDFIGQGQTVVLTPANVTFNVGYTGQTATFSLNNFNQASSGVPLIFWDLDLAAPSGQSLAVGSYPNATRFPFQAATSPGLSVDGDGRGCNQDFGSFQVLEIAVDPSSGTLLRFAADFVQTCESTSAPPLTGSIRYNSAVPLPEVITPIISIAQPVNSRGCYEATSATGVSLSASASAAGGANLAFSWSTSTGLSGSGTQFSFAVGLNQNITLLLTATDTVTGNNKTVTQQVCSSDTTPPTVTIISPVQGGSYHNLPPLNVVVTDAVDKNIKSVVVTNGENASFALDANEQLHARITPRRAIGNQISSQVTVFATDASGNVGQASVNILIDKSVVDSN